MRYLLLSLFFLSHIAFATSKTNMIRFDCYRQQSDPSSPWSKTRIQIAKGNAVKLRKPGLFLTSSEAVAHAEYCEWKVVDTNNIIPMSIEHIDRVLGLAILKTKSSLAEKKQAVIFGNDVNVNTKLDIYSLQKSNEPVRTSLRVKAITQASTNQSYYNFRHLAFDSRSKNLGNGEPIFYKKKLVAIADMKKDGKLLAIPVSIIKSYLNDYFNGEYKGVGLFGFLTGNLNSPFQKQYYKIGLEDSGEMIVKVSDESSFKNQVIANDVLVKIGKYELNSQGNYKNKLWGWLTYRDLLSSYKAGDRVTIELLRNGKRIKVSSVLSKYNPLKDAIVQDPYKIRDYIIFGGLVFQELSIDYLKTWGTDWTEKAPLTYLKKVLYDYENFVSTNHIVILNTVLADKVNKGYDSLGDLVLAKINGTSVTSIKQLRYLMEGINEDFAVLEFEPYGYRVILDVNEVRDSAGRIIKRYNLGKQSKVFGQKL